MPVSVVFGGIQRDRFILVSHVLDSFIRRWSMLQGHAFFFLENLEPRTPRVFKNATMIHPMGIFNIPIHHPNLWLLLDVVGDFPNGWILFKRDSSRPDRDFWPVAWPAWPPRQAGHQAYKCPAKEVDRAYDQEDPNVLRFWRVNLAGGTWRDWIYIYNIIFIVIQVSHTCAIMYGCICIYNINLINI